MSASSSVVAMDHPWFRKYPTGIPHDIEVPNRLLHELVEDSVNRWSDRAALIYYGSRWSYRRFWEESGRFAAALATEGLRPGDRIALYLPNCPVYPIAYFGALRLGLIVTQVSPLYLGQDLARLLRDAEPKAIVVLEIHYPNLEKIAPEWPLPVTYVARLRDLYPPLTRLFVNRVLRRRGLSTAFPTSTNVRRWKEAVRAKGSFPEFKGDAAGTVAVLQYTGGTTGVPKAAMLTHRNLVSNALQCGAWFVGKEPGKEVVLATVPFFHVYGMTVALNYPLLEGATIVLQTRPDVPELLRLIQKYRPTDFPGVPALYQAINQNPNVGKYDIRSIKVCLSGSAPLPLEVAKKFESLTGGRLLEGYGLTEASPVTHANPVVGERRAGSVGLPLPSTEQKIVDSETGTKPVPTGEVGELAVRGPQVMKGYYHQPQESAATLRGGWLYTGDLARLDADGYAYIVDRKKDMINVGGLKVYPRDVEEVLFQHPGVADAAVVGLPDSALGESVHAIVVRKPGASVEPPELIGFVRDRIAHYKAPRTVEFRDQLPRSGVQKVLRRELRQQAIAAQGGSPPVTGPGR